MKARKGIFTAFVLLALVPGCGTTVGNGGPQQVTMSYAPYSSGREVIDLQLGLTQIAFCMKQVRFTTSTGASSGNIALSAGAVTLSPSGTALGTVGVANGVYTRVEFDLDNSCASAMSVSLKTALGLSIGAAEAITLKFSGSFEVSGAARSLSLNVQPIVTSLGGVTTALDIKPLAEGVSGSF